MHPPLTGLRKLIWESGSGLVECEGFCEPSQKIYNAFLGIYFRKKCCWLRVTEGAAFQKSQPAAGLTSPQVGLGAPSQFRGGFQQHNVGRMPRGKTSTLHIRIRPLPWILHGRPNGKCACAVWSASYACEHSVVFTRLPLQKTRHNTVAPNSTVGKLPHPR